MPIVVTSTTYSDEFISGTSTSLNANVSDKIIATHNVYYENTIDASLDSAYSIEVNNTDSISPFVNFNGYDATQGYVILILNQDLSQDISVEQIYELTGKEITFEAISPSLTITAEVLAVETLLGSVGHRIVINDTTNVSRTYGSAVAYVSSNIESLLFQYSFANSGAAQNPALELLKDNMAATFETPTNVLDASNATPVNIPFKYNGAYQTGSLTVAGTGITTSGNIYNRQGFELIHTFEATPISIYSDGDVTQPEEFSIDTNNISSSRLFDISGNAEYEANLILKRNPNDFNGIATEKQFISNLTAGFIDIRPEVSVIGQKFLGGSTDYSFDNFAIVRTSDSEPSDNPLIETKFTVSFDVENTDDSPFSNSNTKVKVGIENIPEDIDNTQNYEGAFLYDHAITTLGAGAIAGEATGDAASITNYTATFNSTSSITVSFDVEYTANAQTQIKLNSVPFFSIFVETQDHLLDYTSSDRVVLQVFKGEGIPNIYEDPIVVNDTQFLTAPYDDFSTGIDASEIDGFPVQMLVGSTQFNADWTDRSELRINEIIQRLVLKNTSTLEEIELDGTNIFLNALGLIDNEYPDASNFLQSKGFKIPNDEVRNIITITNISDVSNVRTFEVFFPFFIRWEDYTPLILTDTPSSIIDNSELNNGVNYDVYRIDQLANWQLDYRITFKCSEGVVNFEQDFDSTISTTTYNEHPDILSRSIKSYSEDGLTELVNGSDKFIDSSEKTLIVVEWEMNYTPALISDFECEFYIEGYENGSPTKIQRISSVNQLLSSSWFTSIDGSGLIEKSISGDKFIGKAYINNNTLANFDSYRLYPTFYSPKRPNEYILAESGDNLVAENGDKFIRDF